MSPDKDKKVPINMRDYKGCLVAVNLKNDSKAPISTAVALLIKSPCNLWSTSA